MNNKKIPRNIRRPFRNFEDEKNTIEKLNRQATVRRERERERERKDEFVVPMDIRLELITPHDEDRIYPPRFLGKRPAIDKWSDAWRVLRT